jgi:aminoglycoside phosphotransferase (APT) family kinase protein
MSDAFKPLDDQSQLEVVRAALGSASARSVERNDLGWDSVVYVVDDGTTVVKFPRSRAAAAAYAREAAALSRIREAGLAVMVPSVRHFDDERGILVLDGLVGRPLDLDWADDELQAAWGRELGTGLAQLHRLPAAGLDLPVYDDARQVEHFRSRFHASAELLDPLPSRTCDCLAELISVELPARLSARDHPAVFCHGDAGPWNMIVTAEGRLGLIDLGDASLADPVLDFRFAWPSVMSAAAFDAYGADAALRDLAHLLAGLRPILDLPGLHARGDTHQLRTALAELARFAACH